MCTSKVKMIGVGVPAVCVLGFAAGVFLYGTPAIKSLKASPDDKPAQVPVAREKPRLDKELLATLLQNAQLRNELQHVASLEEILKLYEAMAEGGDASVAEAQEVEQEFLKARISVLRRQAEYIDSADLIGSRLGVDPKGLQKAEELVLGPLTRQLKGFQDVFEEFETLRSGLVKYGEPDKAPKLRAELRQALASAALLQGTRFRTEFLGSWDAWEKLSSDEVEKRQAGLREERRGLLQENSDLQIKGRALSAPQQQRLNTLVLHINLGHFELVLRDYESEPWKNLVNPDGRRREQGTKFLHLLDELTLVLAEGRNERLQSFRLTWPKLPPIAIEGQDLLKGEWKYAEEKLVTFSAKKADAVAAAKRQLRKARTLFEVYEIQQRLIAVAYDRWGNVRENGFSPQIQKESSRPDDAGSILRKLLAAEDSLTRVKGQLLTTWIDYQIARLELYRDLGLALP
jgi:hypothetical protein